MLTLVSVLVLGFILGMRHATDPDHVVAVTTIVTRERSLRAAAPIGALWGIGHTLTVTLVGGLIVLTGLAIPPRLGLGMELVVALMLIILGARNLYRGRRDHAPHADDPRADRLLAKLPARPTLQRYARPLIIGIIHGLAGSAAIALLVVGAIHDPGWALGYLLVFGVGTIFGMFLVTSAIALPVAYTAGRFERLHHMLGLGAAVLSVSFGLFLVYDISVVHGLFSASPTWTPE
jgi:high-affinity nickel-transport protein